jgi:hypothetical protein
LRVEGFSCSLGVLLEGLGISKMLFLKKNQNQKFPAVNFFQFFVIITLDLVVNPDPHWDLDPDPLWDLDPALQLEKMLDPDPLNQCGSTTLHFWLFGNCSSLSVFALAK